MVSKLAVDGLSRRWAGQQRHLITRISFEDRSLIVTRALASGGCLRCTGFASALRSEAAEANLKEFRRMFPAARIHELDTAKALETADALYTAVKSRSGGNGTARSRHRCHLVSPRRTADARGHTAPRCTTR